jgi:uncharacterized RDD family membrane protein YckC
MDISRIAPQEPAQERKEDAEGLLSAPREPLLNQAPEDSISHGESQAMSGELKDEFAGDLRGRGKETANPRAAEAPGSWRQELSARVKSFHQRRAHLRNDQNLEFHFQPREEDAPWEGGEENILEFPENSRTLDADIALPKAGRSGEAGHLNVKTLQEDDENLQKDRRRLEILNSALVKTREFTLEPASPENRDLEVLVGPTEVDAQTAASQLELQGVPVAPLGRRFRAGLADGLILLLGAGVFALIAWLAGTHLTLAPLNLAVLALLAAIFVLAYFGLFTAITFSTPGQIWMRIEVRNMEGWPPLPWESFLRGFGYLVSFSTFMMGFLWALVDSDGLTWHDQISGTFLTPLDQESRGEGAESNVAL